MSIAADNKWVLRTRAVLGTTEAGRSRQDEARAAEHGKPQGPAS